MARTKKLTDPIYSPTNPTSEAAIRAQIDDSIQEVYDQSAKATDTVNLTGNQTVAGIKTFSLSPIVPTPTTSTQVANKAYVDGVAISATIPLDSLTDNYLASAPGNIKPRFSNFEADYEYQTPTVVGQQIRISKLGASLISKFYLSTPVTGGAITISTDGGATSVALKNGAGEAVTELNAGLVEVAYVSGFFILRSSGGLDSFFGDGSDGTIPNLNLVTTAPNGGTVANLWDMNEGTTFVTSSLGASEDVVVFQIDFGSSTLLTNLYLWQALVSTARTFAVQSSTNGSVWTQRATQALTTSATNYQISISNIGARYWRLVTTAGTAGEFTCQGAIINFVTGDTQTTKVWRILEPSTLNGAAVVKQYTNFNLPAGYEITVQNPNQGLIIYSQNDITNAGVIDMSQKAGLAPNGNAIPMLISKKAYKTAKTSSLLHFDNNIIDDSGKTWTNNGSATFDATNKKFGSHSISFNGTSQYLTTPTHSDFNFGNEDFTIDYWARPTTLDGAPRKMFVTDSISIYVYTGNKVGVNVLGVGGAGVTLTAQTAMTLNTYSHIEISRSDGVIRLFIDGVLQGTDNFNVPLYIGTYQYAYIGQSGSNDQYFAGQIDELRITKGKAMHTANFTPPVSAYTYQATYIDEPKTLEKYFQLTNVLQTLRGGYGGNGSYGGGYSGSTGRQTSVGIGGAGRQNLGGFGGGGSGGGSGSAVLQGGIGGSVTNAEIGGGFLPQFASGTSTPSNGVNGSGGKSANGATVVSASVGVCFGGGTGGLGGTNAGVVGTASSDSQYAGGFFMGIAKNNITITGTARANGGAGSNGTSASNGDAGGGGGGGGAGGGVIALFYGNVYTNTGTVQVNGGSGGTGGTGIGVGEVGGTGTSGSVGTIHTQKI